MLIWVEIIYRQTALLATNVLHCKEFGIMFINIWQPLHVATSWVTTWSALSSAVKWNAPRLAYTETDFSKFAHVEICLSYSVYWRIKPFYIYTSLHDCTNEMILWRFACANGITTVLENSACAEYSFLFIFLKLIVSLIRFVSHLI